MSKAVKISFWISVTLASLALVAGGAAKLASVEQVHTSFSVMGLPVWFGYFIGLCEVLGGIGLWLRKVSALAAGGLLIIMAGAMYFHIVYDSIANGIPAFVISLLLIHILISRIKNSIN
ncbi:DoxX family protein [Arenicella xantha]|uniref:DoxX-like protein n=1 Tax=Arenicella xantha TaxID=644221 RepID=A0A395JLW8_9GAMM|nr:DoxX family protein [Arenicella xantha]RBP50658.1 DoxX-like protein [Arenicella xantha]